MFPFFVDDLQKRLTLFSDGHMEWCLVHVTSVTPVPLEGETLDNCAYFFVISLR